MLSKDIDEERVIHSKIDNIKIMIYDKADEVIKKTGCQKRYQKDIKLG